jgi:hypothetical protein
MCVNHYMQWIRSNGGKAKGVAPSRLTSPTDRWWAKVDKQGQTPSLRPDLGPCWYWTVALDDGGYGWLKVGNKHVAAHRFGYELLIGSIPEGLEVDHLCNVRHCVNPDHLEAVTRTENNNRQVPRRTHCKHGHPYEPNNYWLVPTGDGRRARRCKTCQYLRVKKKERERGVR